MPRSWRALVHVINARGRTCEGFDVSVRDNVLTVWQPRLWRALRSATAWRHRPGPRFYDRQWSRHHRRAWLRHQAGRRYEAV